MKESGKEGTNNAVTTKTTSTKTKQTTDKDKNDKKKEEEPEVSPWPPFTFDGSNALKTRLVLNLRNCQYDLFRTIALEELNWKIVDQFHRVWEPKSHNPNLHPQEEQQPAAKPEAVEEKKSEKSTSNNEEEDSTGETAAKSGDDQAEKANSQK